MSLVVRVEKLKFILDEMQISLHLTKNIKDDPTARMIARHIVIRTENFIAHARRLKKPLNAAGFNTSAFHKTKEAYANSFEEYFQDARHKLGAHIQDIDFGKRIELWNDIESIKIDYFVEGAHEIYQIIDDLGIPYVSSNSDPLELVDSELIRDIESFNASAGSRTGVEIGIDPLAMTRKNTVAVLDGAPVRIRAGQLTLIRRWVKAQRNLMEHLQGHDRVVRIIKERVLTDIVSFYDCLVTRTVTANSPQEMDGLDRLLSAEGEQVDPITHFLQNYNIPGSLDAIRDVRNKIGSHLEIEDTFSMPVLLNSLDSISLHNALDFYDKIESVFLKVCRNTFFLRDHLSDGSLLNGVMAGNVTGNSAVVPYNEDLPIHPSGDVFTQKFDDDAVYSENFEKWLSSDQATKEEGRYYFYSAFMHATSIEEFITKESLGGSSMRYNRHHFRTSHDFILRKLLSAPDEKLSGYILLLEACGNGDPDVLSETVERFLKHSNRLNVYPLTCYVFGQLSSWTNENVRGFLEGCARSSIDIDTALLARIALLNIYIRSEGLSRINRQPYRVEYQDAIGWLTDQLTGVEKLLNEIVLASQFCGPQLCTYRDQFIEDREAVPGELENLCRDHIFKEAFEDAENLVHDLINSDDYVGLCLIISDQLEQDGRSEIAKLTLSLVCRGFVVVAHHDQALRHFAVCYHRLKEPHSALELASKLAIKNPEDANYQIFKLQILASIPERHDEVTTGAERLRRQYILNMDQENDLNTIEATLGDSS